MQALDAERCPSGRYSPTGPIADRAAGTGNADTMRPASHDRLTPSGTVRAMNETTEGLLHPLLSSRWSPTTFDGSMDVTSAEVESLLEAARWAPSAGNSQPGFHPWLPGRTHS